MPLLSVASANDLASILEARGNPMAACRAKWLLEFQDVPDDAAPPLAMSPRHPRATGSYGAQCIAWAKEKFGITFRWWQALAITRQLEHDKDGVLVWREIIDTGPRRIGKSVRLRVVALWRIANSDLVRSADGRTETQMVMLVSKDLAVGREIHRQSWRWAETQWGRGSVIRLNGSQEVIAPGDHRWLLRADTAVYGYDVCYAQADESWGIDPPAIADGLEPALLERIWPQLHLTSTAHVKATSLMRRRLVAALRQSDEDVLLMFWGAHPDWAYDDPTTWQLSSPHWSDDRAKLVMRKYLAAKAGQDEPEFDDPDPIRGWASQYLNVWPHLLDSGKSIFPNWSSLATTLSPGDPQALGVATDLDQNWLSLGAVSGGTRPHLGSILRTRSTEQPFFISEVKRIQDAHKIPVVVDAKGPAGYLIKDLVKAEVDVTIVGLDELVQACADLDKVIASSQVEHGEYTVLNDAVGSATWRKVGDRRVFGRKDGDISMLEAVTLALWAVMRVPAPPAPAPFFLR